MHGGAQLLLDETIPANAPMPQVEFQCLDSEARFYPRSEIPMTPVWPLLRLGNGNRKRIWPSRFVAKDCVRVSGGRYAIALALQAAGIRRGDQVLFPAYHCGSMIEPALSLGCTVDFYRHQKDLTPDMEDLVRRMAGGVRAVVVTHFFGFPQPAAALRTLCDQHGAILIEDCAHALFGNYGGVPPGSCGHYAVASTRKFCPGPDGGIACSNNFGAPTWPSCTPAGAERQLHALYRVGTGMLTYMMSMGRLPAVPISGRRFGSVLLNKDVPRSTHSPSDKGSSPMRWFKTDESGIRWTFIAASLFRLADSDRIAAARRQNYRFLLHQSAPFSRAYPLYPELPDGVVPYAFPLVLRHPKEDFRQLKLRGVPIWRWDELARSDCKVSQSFRHTLLQLPCHENLGAPTLNWLAGLLSEVLA